MELPQRARVAAEAAWQALHAHDITPTPRNFTIWFTYFDEEKPPLRQRINKLIEAAEPVTAAALDSLYNDFFADHIDVRAVRQNSQELQQIATRMATQVTSDRGAIGAYGVALKGWQPVFDSEPTIQTMREAIDALRTATAETGSRMRALEQLFTASVMRIGELNEKLARSEQEAACDPLTGLANRRTFDVALAKAAAQADSDGTSVALLLLDIDHFKRFNDAHGHVMGDNVLRLVAQVLTSHIKGRDLAARYGGEEYAIILVGADVQAAMTVAEQIRSLLQTRPLLNRTTGEKFGVITCSIGVAVHHPGEAPATLVERADQALYKAKRSGRNRVSTQEIR